MINLLINVKRGMRILKYFNVTVGLQKTDCLSEDLLLFKRKQTAKMMFKYVVPYIRTSF